MTIIRYLLGRLQPPAGYLIRSFGLGPGLVLLTEIAMREREKLRSHLYNESIVELS